MRASIFSKIDQSCVAHQNSDIIEKVDSAIKSCISIKQLKQFHAYIFRSHLHQNNSLACTLITLYSRFSLSCHSLFIFSSITIPTVSLFNYAIKTFSKNPSFSRHCIQFYATMLRKRVKPDNYTYPFLLKACASSLDLRHGEEIHGRIVKSGFYSFLPVSNGLVDMYGKCDLLNSAHQLFDEMFDRDVVSYNAILGAHARAGKDLDIAKRLFDTMPIKNVISWNSMIAGYMNVGDLDSAQKTFKNMPDRNLVSWTTMVSGYCKNGRIDLAQPLFDKMPERNSVSWTAMITGYAQNGQPEKAISLFREMELEKIRPDSITMMGVISSTAQLGRPELANWVISYMDRQFIKRDEKILASLIDMHAKCGNIEGAFKLFNQISRPDVISYSALITGLASHGYGNEALEIFQQMKLNGVEPNCVTFIGVLTACSHAGLVEEGWKFWESMVRDYNIKRVPNHYACMVDILSRADRLKEAHELVENMHTGPHAGALGSLLACCKNHNNVEIAESVAEILFELEPENTGNYMLLADIYSSNQRWDDAQRVKALMERRRIKKLRGCSWIEVSNDSDHKVPVNN